MGIIGGRWLGLWLWEADDSFASELDVFYGRNLQQSDGQGTCRMALWNVRNVDGILLKVWINYWSMGGGIGELGIDVVPFLPTAWVVPFWLSQIWPLWRSCVNTCQSQMVDTALQFKLCTDHAIFCAPIKMLMPKVDILGAGKATLLIIWLVFSEVE